MTNEYLYVTSYGYKAIYHIIRYQIVSSMLCILVIALVIQVNA